MLLSSKNKSKIIDNVYLTQYKLSTFSYDIDKELLKGTKISIIENSGVLLIKQIDYILVMVFLI